MDDGKETISLLSARETDRGSHKYSRTLTSWMEGEQLVPYFQLNAGKIPILARDAIKRSN